jgi:pimeloyl-ACP methyl ester carboxylesterase
MTMTKARLLFGSLACVCIASCAVAPANLKRVVRQMKPGEAHLHVLLEKAMTAPAQAASADALAHFVEAWKLQKRPASGEIRAERVDGVTYQVRFGGTRWGSYPLDYFDEISPASAFEIRRLAHHRREGVGAPLTALRENRKREPLEKFYPPEAITRPLTAFATAGPVRGGVCRVQIELLCPLVNSSVESMGKRQPLAADFSVPWAAALARTGKLNQSRILDMLTSTPKREPQLYLMEPYDPNKEPLIMIHGLLSTPLAWAEMSNELWADDSIRQRYQIWHYLYNTSAPALYSARILRTQLRELRTILDPSGHDHASRRTTLLTHSMGGLVGKALVVKPGDAFWKAAFTVPHETLKLPSSDRAMLQDAFEWQPDSAVQRVIFVAVPHRGSNFANSIAGRIGRWITAPPQPFQSFYQRVSKENPNVFTPAYQELGRGHLDSIDSLSPRQPTLHILAALPFAKGVTVHSIIGDRGKPGPVELSSDGVVPYTSSHIEVAASEKIVPAGHGAFRHPDAIAEIRRILNLR